MVKAAERTAEWPQDSTRIDVREASDIQFWSQRFHVSAETLKQVVQAVGPKFKDVRAQIESPCGRMRPPG
jgi:hypothetical protein